MVFQSMESSHKDKIVIVAGGSKGIGLACASAFLRNGARVALVSRSSKNLEVAEKKLGPVGDNACFVVADLTSSDGAARMLAVVKQVFGVPHVLVNSAGAAKRTPVFEVRESDWRDAMDAKFFTYVNSMTTCLPDMAKAGRGAVVNIVGMGGKFATPTHLPGGAANAALMLVTAGLANAYAPMGVRVNTVNPSLTLTDRVSEGFAAEARHRGISSAQAEEDATKRLPLGRIASPEEVANVVLFLASSDASYVNGANLAIDGGQYSTIV